MLGLTILSYGLWIPWLGLFGDDLSYLFYYHRLGPWGPGAFASIDRPASAVFYAISTVLLGETVWAYHILLLVLRWLSAVLLWWVLGLTWPEHKREAVLAALLLVIYPGFRQNPIALEFILHFFVLDLFLLSLGTMLLSARERSSALGERSSPLREYGSRRFWLLALATAFGASGVFSLEYFIGLEILRPILLWVVTRRSGLNGRAQWKRILSAWLPALVVVLAFVFWRVFIFAFPTYRPVLLDDLRANPLAALFQLSKRILRDGWTVLAGAWLQTVKLPAGRRMLLAFGGLALAGAALAGLAWWRAGTQNNQHGAFRWGAALLGIGLLAMLAGGSIFWLAGIPVELPFPWDRSTLAFMPGVCLVITGLLAMLPWRVRPLLAAGLVGLSVGMHFINAAEYHNEWQKLQDFYWQFTWRVPQMEPGTLVLFDVIPLNRYSDNDMTALLNWTYDPQSHAQQVDYKFFDLTIRLDDTYAGLPGTEKGLQVEHNHRGLLFKTTTSNTLALEYDPPACLKILDPADATALELPERLARVLPMTRVKQIRWEGEAARPPAAIGAEPAHGWCYYFQKADLARQQGNWSAVAALGEEAISRNLRPGDPSELLPFIEGYLHTGGLERAQSLTAEVAQKVDHKLALCAAWKGAGQVPQTELGCPP